MAKQLRPLRFAESILDDYENFHFCIEKATNQYPDKAIMETVFNWEWYGYEGFGSIFLKNGIIDDNEYLCKSSKMTVHSSSKRQVSNGRNECTLYNDEKLKELFDLILSQKQK